MECARYSSQRDPRSFAIAPFDFDDQRLAENADAIEEIGLFFIYDPLPARFDAIAELFAGNKVPLNVLAVGCVNATTNIN